MPSPGTSDVARQQTGAEAMRDFTKEELLGAAISLAREKIRLDPCELERDRRKVRIHPPGPDGGWLFTCDHEHHMTVSGRCFRGFLKDEEVVLRARMIALCGEDQRQPVDESNQDGLGSSKCECDNPNHGQCDYCRRRSDR